MKAYLIITCALFGLITLAHLVRIITEWPYPAKEPLFILLTFAAGALCFWGWRLLRRSTVS